jgi:hypothetical protein
MSDDVGIHSKFDRLPPLEKLGDSKKGMNRQDAPRKRKKKKGEEEQPTAESSQKEKQENVDSSEREPSGKIIDIVI